MRAFTLTEVVVVVGIFTGLLALGLFMSIETLRGTIYRSEQATIVGMLGRARSRAMNNIEQSPWGFCYTPPNYIVFKGSVCSAAAAYEVTPVNTAVASSSGFGIAFPSIVFTQLSGTSTAATITVVQDGRNRITTINNEGAIIW
jgi:Tfp pilus assembly protein FimT